MTIDKKRLKKDPIYFIEEIVGMKMMDFQKEWLRLVEKKKRVTFMAFRSSGKTRMLFVNYFLWQAMTKPKKQFLIISKTLPQAIEVLKDIRITILTNPILKTMVPSNRNQSWSRTELELKNHSRILSKAYNENVRGLHVDGLGCDEMGEYQDHKVLTDAVLPTIRAKRGFFVGVGTPKSELDLLHEIESNPGFSSIYFDRYPAEGEKGHLFHERYPDTIVKHEDSSVQVHDRDDGRLLESYSNMTWSQEFLLRPVSLQDRLFPDNLINECLDPSLRFTEQPENMKQYFMGVDFAMSAQSGSDFTVVTVLEKSPTSKELKLIWLERWRGLDYSIQKERIQEIADRYQIIKALGDEGSFGKTFIYDLKAAGVPIEGYKFTHQSSSKEELIKAMRDQFEKKGFILPYSNECPRTYVTMKKLVNELTKFGIIFDYKKGIVKFEGTGQHDDMVISLGLANFIARHVSIGCFKVIRNATQTRGNPFAVSKA
jgi:phage terminase large subunit-like protein